MKVYIVEIKTVSAVWGSSPEDARRELERCISKGEADGDTESDVTELRRKEQLPHSYDLDTCPHGKGPDEVTVGMYLEQPQEIKVRVKPWQLDRLKEFVKNLEGSMGDE
jgi:hypothetical protein